MAREDGARRKERKDERTVAMEKMVMELAAAAAVVDGNKTSVSERASGGSGGSSLTRAPDAEREREEGQALTLDALVMASAGSNKRAKSAGVKVAKRKKMEDKGERRWYCCSCKQTLTPEHFDPNLETCRLCLAKRRAKDRAKKRLRGLQLKHHLLSADEKDVAAFLLGVYHPALTQQGPRSSSFNSIQMNVQRASMEVSAFVEDFRSFLEDKPKEQADRLVRTFLGLDDAGERLTPHQVINEKGSAKRNTMSSKANSAKATHNYRAPASSMGGRQELTKSLDTVYDKYDALLKNTSDDQTWVRFAAENEQDTDLDAEKVNYSAPIHESAAETGTNEKDDVYSAIMHGADPTVSHYLYQFLFMNQPTIRGEHSTGVVESDLPQLTGQLPLRAVDSLSEGSSLNGATNVSSESDNVYTTLDEEELNGNAYAFKGSLVMGWIGGARDGKRELLAKENGILPDDMHPQAVFSHGRLFDARTPGKLVPLTETENLHGFSEDLAIFPVKDSSSDIVRIHIPPGSFSEELGVRALHDGHYIDSELRHRRNGGAEVILYPNGRDDRKRNAIVILGAVHLQCFVRSGTAKQMPIGCNIPALFIPSQAHAKEISDGVEHIAQVKGTKAARQFLSSLAYVLVHGEPKSAKFEFVVEMAHILALTRTLDLLERLAMLAKSSLSSDDSDTSISEVAILEVYKPSDNFWQHAGHTNPFLGMPLLCLVAGFIRLIASAMSGARLNYGFYATLLAAAALSATNPKTRVDIKSIAFNMFFIWAHAASMHSDDLTNQMTSYGKALVITLALSALNASRSRMSSSSSFVLPQLAFARSGYNPHTIFRFMKQALPQDGSIPQNALRAHAWTVHISCALLAPAILISCISQLPGARVRSKSKLA